MHNRRAATVDACRGAGGHTRYTKRSYRLLATMQVASMHFKARVGGKLADVKLQAALKKLQSNFVKGRADRVAEVDNFEELRTHAAAIRDRALNNLDVYLEEFEKNATARGAVVHWAETTADVNR